MTERGGKGREGREGDVRDYGYSPEQSRWPHGAIKHGISIPLPYEKTPFCHSQSLPLTVSIEAS